MRLFKLISAVPVSCLLILLFLIASTYSLSEVSQTISSSGIIRVPAVTLFETGFEKGDLSEVDLETAYNGVVEITTHAFNGQYAARCYGFQIGSPAPRARIYPKGYSIEPVTEVNVRAYFCFQRLDGYVQCIRTAGEINGTYTYIARTLVHQSDIRLQLAEEITKPYSFELGNWYCIEMRFVKGVNGEAKVWVNGEEVISYSGDTSSFPNVKYALVGVILCNAPVDIYVDNFVVAKGYIGR